MGTENPYGIFDRTGRCGDLCSGRLAELRNRNTPSRLRRISVPGAGGHAVADLIRWSQVRSLHGHQPYPSVRKAQEFRPAWPELGHARVDTTPTTGNRPSPYLAEWTRVAASAPPFGRPRIAVHRSLRQLQAGFGYYVRYVNLSRLEASVRRCATARCCAPECRRQYVRYSTAAELRAAGATNYGAAASNHQLDCITSGKSTASRTRHTIRQNCKSSLPSVERSTGLSTIFQRSVGRQAAQSERFLSSHST
jgi:hypothetical protein